MTNVVNLNQFRKKKARDDAAQSAEENRTKFGRTNAQKKRDESEDAKAAQHLDGHKSEDDES